MITHNGVAYLTVEETGMMLNRSTPTVSALITGEPMDCAGPDKIVVEETDACGTVTHEEDNPEPYVCVVRGLIVLCPRSLKEPCTFSEIGPTMYSEEP